MQRLVGQEVWKKWQQDRRTARQLERDAADDERGAWTQGGEGTAGRRRGPGPRAASGAASVGDTEHRMEEVGAGAVRAGRQGEDTWASREKFLRSAKDEEVYWPVWVARGRGRTFEARRCGPDE